MAGRAACNAASASSDTVIAMPAASPEKNSDRIGRRSSSSPSSRTVRCRSLASAAFRSSSSEVSEGASIVTCNGRGAMNDPATIRRLYGRRQGHKLRVGQAALVEETLDALSVPETGPIEGKALFGDDRPLELEIGFGAGEHLAGQATMRPETGFIGCEPFLNGVVGALGHIRDGGLTNVRLHMGDALDVVERLPDASLSRVYLLHPDPWRKARHAKRRMPSAAAFRLSLLGWGDPGRHGDVDHRRHAGDRPDRVDRGVGGELIARASEEEAGAGGARRGLASADPTPMPRLPLHILTIAAREGQLEPEARRIGEQPARGRGRRHTCFGIGAAVRRADREIERIARRMFAMPGRGDRNRTRGIGIDGARAHHCGIALCRGEQAFEIGDDVAPQQAAVQPEAARRLDQIVRRRVAIGQRWPQAVHRLDRDTSGCLLLSRNPKAHARLQQAFERGEVEKRYLAILAGVPRESAGEIDLALAKVSTRETGWRMVADPAGKVAHTAWRTLAVQDGRALVEFRPTTGRTHQIRVHAASGLGLPVVGDPIYGAGETGGMMLHAAALTVPRANKEPVRAEAPLPERFGAWPDLAEA
ncbi:hypothetical protein WR25_17607 [Diploscapter pachys]|uniref:tRNA (guanine(46)-N(7))-methyltransferase n=1 Tax=Diploscapter pachys TaxID=2018661 RepID=A0A2A2K6H5_9BILA|nr:hypothetical protein WR25_17607 [Diploscapter pachys]